MSRPTEEQIAELANAVALQAEALATGDHTAKREAVVRLLAGNVQTLEAWIIVLDNPSVLDY